MTFGECFAGIGGWSVGLQRAGLRCLFQIENDRHCNTILERNFQEVLRRGDIRDVDPDGLPRVDVLCGGDPCPFRSRARSIHGTDSPDLFPEFLRIVSSLRPFWVLREHVVADDTDECAAMLADLGYAPIVLEMDGAEITGQSRPREFLCGVLASSGICPGHVFSDPERTGGDLASIPETSPIAACLTSHPRRFDTRDNYVLEPGRGTRILATIERERLQGFDDGWTSGVAFWPAARLTGNALITHKAEWIGRRLMTFGGSN